VFVVGFDPIAGGLVDSLSRPSGNATGMTLLTGPLGQKRIEQLRELVPKAAIIAMLANPLSPDAVPEIRDVQAAAQANNLQLKMYNASSRAELDAASILSPHSVPTPFLLGPIHSMWPDVMISLHLQHVTSFRPSIHFASLLMSAD
jgi:putative ABC transport system substrate-binding protein